MRKRRRLRGVGGAAIPVRATPTPRFVRIFAAGLAAVVALIALEVTVLGYAWSLHRQARFDDEIAWLDTMRPWLPWERGIDSQLERLQRQRVQRELDARRLAPAVQAFREARAREMRRGRPLGRELTALGIECYTQAAKHVESLGRLTAAADWNDSLFVLAVRGPEPHHRFAATAAFLQGLELRVRDGKPCAALARIEWARRGIGDIPGLPAEAEPDLRTRCETAMKVGPSRKRAVGSSGALATRPTWAPAGTAPSGRVPMAAANPAATTPTIPTPGVRAAEAAERPAANGSRR